MFLPENIDLARSESYDLSIRLTPDGFSFCIHSVVDPTIFHYQETGLGSKFTYTENIKRLIFDLGFFSQPFRQTSVTIVSPKYTLVPDPFFDSKKAQEVFAYNFHDTGGVILTQPIDTGEYHVVFHIDEGVHSFLSRNLWNPSFRHHVSSLLPLFRSRLKGENSRSCFVDFHDEMISTACFDGENLLSSNMFPTTHPKDTLYYIVNVWDNSGFDQLGDRLFLSGNIASQQPVIDELKGVIREIEQLRFTPKTHLSEGQKRSLPTGIIAMLCE